MVKKHELADEPMDCVTWSYSMDAIQKYSEELLDLIMARDEHPSPVIEVLNALSAKEKE